MDEDELIAELLKKARAYAFSVFQARLELIDTKQALLDVEKRAAEDEFEEAGKRLTQIENEL